MQTNAVELSNKILLTPLNEIIKEKRSLTKIVNIIKSNCFKPNDLNFDYKTSESCDYIEISPKKTGNLWNWKVYLNENKEIGLLVEYLEYVNYQNIDKQASIEIGKFIYSKKWVDNNAISFKKTEINIELQRIQRKKDKIDTFCFFR